MWRKNIGKKARFEESICRNTQTDKFKHVGPKYLILDEINALLHVIKDPRDQAIFRLGYHHGLRASEVGMIQMQDYHPGRRAEKDYLWIQRLKGSKSGETCLIPAAAHALRMWLKKRGPKSGPIFITRKHTAITRQRLDQLMKHYGALAGIPRDKRHFHCLKHTCGTIMLSVWKEPITDVQRQLGHVDIRNTMIYAELTEQANEERANRLRNWR